MFDELKLIKINKKNKKFQFNLSYKSIKTSF